MSVRGLLALYRARLRARALLVQELLAIVGIAVGVALLFASQVASTSLSSSVAQVDRQVIGRAQQFQLQSRSAAGFAERVLGEVRAAPGVQGAFPLLEEQANVIGPGGDRSVDLVGLDPNFSQLAGPLAQRFSSAQLAAQRAIALPEPMAQAVGAGPLQPVSIQVRGHATQALVGATLGEGEIGAMVNNPVAIAPVAYAQRLAQMPGAITRVFVRARPGQAARAHSALALLASRANLNLEPAGFDATLFSVAVAPDSKSEALFSAISALVGFVFALNAMLITVPARRRLIQEIRPHGASLAMIIEILAFDALVIGAVGCVIGLALGDVLSIAVFRSTPGYLAFAFPVGNNRIVTWQTVTLAVGAGLLAAVAGVFWPLRDTMTRDAGKPEERSGLPAGLTGARLALGVGSLILTTVILLADTRAAVIGDLALVIAVVCLLPFLFDLAVLAFKRGQDRFGGAAGRLASTELRTPHTRVRSLAISATAALAVFGTVEFGGIVHNLSRALDASARGIDSMAAVWITPRGESNAFATTAFTDTHSRALAEIPGVKSVGIYRGSFLNWGRRRLWVLAPAANVQQPVPAGQLLDGNTSLAGIRIRDGGWVILSQALGAEHHLRVGQTFTLPAPRPIRLRVAGLSTNLGWAPGAMILNPTDYAHAWASSDPSAYQLQLQPGASPIAVRTAAADVLGPRNALVAETAAQRERRHYALAGQGLSRLTQIRLLVLIAALLAVTGAIGAMIWQRRELVAFMKCDGYPRSVLLRWLLYESAVLLGTGCFAGAAFGLYGQLLGSHFLAGVTGFPVAFNVEAFSAVSTFGLVTLAAVAITTLPGYLVVRVPAQTVNPAY